MYPDLSPDIKLAVNESHMTQVIGTLSTETVFSRSPLVVYHKCNNPFIEPAATNLQSGLKQALPVAVGLR